MKVKVVNKNVHPYKEKFKGNDYAIPAGGFIEMEQEDAIQLLGTFNGVVLTADGQADPVSFKKLYIEELDTPKTKGKND